MLRSLRARLARWWWVLAAGGVLLLFVLSRLRGRRRPAMVGELLRRAHEAEVRAELAKRRISREAEAEVQAIRAGLREDLGEITARRIDRVAALTRDGDELLEVYRLRARGYGL